MNYKEDFTMEKKSTKLVARIALALLVGVVAVSTATAKPSLKGFLKSVTATKEDKLVSEEDKLVSDYETQVAAVEKACADKDWAAFDSALKAIDKISRRDAVRNLNDTQRAKCAELKARKAAAFKTAPAMPENFFKVKLCANDTGVCVTALDTSKEGARDCMSVIIPPTIQGMPVLAVNLKVGIIVLPEGVKYASIGSGSVQLPEGLLYLDCSDTTVDNFPSTLKVISGSLWVPKKTVEELSFPENLILEASLRGSVKKVVLPKKMSFGPTGPYEVFEQLTAVEDVVIPADHNYNCYDYSRAVSTVPENGVIKGWTLAKFFGKFDSILMQKKLKDCKFDETYNPDDIVTWKDYRKWQDDCKVSDY